MKKLLLTGLLLLPMVAFAQSDEFVKISGDTMTGGLLIVDGGPGTEVIDAGLLLQIIGDVSFDQLVGVGTNAPGTSLEILGTISPTALKQGHLSVDGLLYSNLEGGAYIGGVGVREQQLSLRKFTRRWVPREQNRAWNAVAANSDAKYQTAVVYFGQIYTSSNYGTTWTARESNRAWNGIAMSADGKIQVATANSTNIFISTDYGATWTPRDSNRPWEHVAVSSDGRYMTAVVNTGQIYTSSDFGVNWTAREQNRGWEGVAVSSNGRYQTAVASGDRIYTSGDYGATWTARDSDRGWVAVTMSNDGKYQFAADATGLAMYGSSDYGTTWTSRILGSWSDIAVSSDGRIVVGVENGDDIWFSPNYGVNWSIDHEEARNWTSIAMSSDAKMLVATVNNPVTNGQIYISATESFLHGNLAVEDALLLGSGAVISHTGNSEFIRLTNTTTNHTAGIFTGSGSPLSVISAGAGSVFLDTTNGKAYLRGVSNWAELLTTSSLDNAKMTRDAAQTIATNTATKIAFDTTEFNNGSVADLGNSRFVIQKAGIYTVNAAFTLLVNDNDPMRAFIYKNGAAVTSSNKRQATGGNNSPLSVEVSDTLQLAVGDVIEFYGFHNSGTNEATQTAQDTKPRMSVVQVD